MDWSTDPSDKDANAEVEKPSELNIFKAKLDYRLNTTTPKISMASLKTKEQQIFLKMLRDLTDDEESMAMFKTNIVISRISF